MSPTISFEGATDFGISGGNFGTVKGNVETVNDNSLHSLPESSGQLSIGSHAGRLAAGQPRRRRTSSNRSTTSHSNAAPLPSTSNESLRDSESSTNNINNISIPPNPPYTTTPTSINNHNQPPASSNNPLNFNNVPPTQTWTQRGGPPQGLSDSPDSQVNYPPQRLTLVQQLTLVPVTGVEKSTTSTLPPYPGRTEQSPQGGHDATPGPYGVESRRYVQSPPPPIRMPPTPHRQHIAQQHSPRLYASQQYTSPHYFPQYTSPQHAPQQCTPQQYSSPQNVSQQSTPQQYSSQYNSHQYDPHQHVPRPISHSGSSVSASTYTNNTTLHSHTVPPPGPYSSTPTFVPCHVAPQIQSPYSRVHNRPLPPIPHTAHAFASHIHTSHQTFTPNGAVHRQTSHLSPRSHRTPDIFSRSGAGVNDPQVRTALNYDFRSRVHQVPYQYTAAPVAAYSPNGHSPSLGGSDLQLQSPSRHWNDVHWNGSPHPYVHYSPAPEDHTRSVPRGGFGYRPEGR